MRRAGVVVAPGASGSVPGGIANERHLGREDAMRFVLTLSFSILALLFLFLIRLARVAPLCG